MSVSPRENELGSYGEECKHLYDKSGKELYDLVVATWNLRTSSKKTRIKIIQDFKLYKKVEEHSSTWLETFMPLVESEYLAMLQVTAHRDYIVRRCKELSSQNEWNSPKFVEHLLTFARQGTRIAKLLLQYNMLYPDFFGGDKIGDLIAFKADIDVLNAIIADKTLGPRLTAYTLLKRLIPRATDTDIDELIQCIQASKVSKKRLIELLNQNEILALKVLNEERLRLHFLGNPVDARAIQAFIDLNHVSIHWRLFEPHDFFSWDEPQIDELFRNMSLIKYAKSDSRTCLAILKLQLSKLQRGKNQTKSNNVFSGLQLLELVNSDVATLNRTSKLQ